MIKSFKDLTVWKKSFGLVKNVYYLTEKLPESEKFGLINQLRRCSISIPANIAEGSKRGSRKDYTQFLRISYGSSAELETQLLLAHELYDLPIDAELTLVDEVQKMLQSMMSKLTASKT